MIIQLKEEYEEAIIKIDNDFEENGLIRIVLVNANDEDDFFEATVNATDLLCAVITLQK